MVLESGGRGGGSNAFADLVEFFSVFDVELNFARLSPQWRRENVGGRGDMENI